MTRFGYFLGSEDHDPRGLVRQARLAEEAGFDEVYVGRVGLDTDGFFEFCAGRILPRLRDETASVPTRGRAA